MIPAGLSAAQFSAFQDACNTGTMVSTAATIMNLSHVPLARVASTEIVDGQVDFVPDASVERTVSVGFEDVDHSLAFDSNSPSAGFTGLATLVGITQNVWVDALGRWVPVPMGVFRPTRPKRDGAVITIEGQDKSCLFLTPKSPHTLPAHEYVIKAVYQEFYRLGERRFRFPSKYALKALTPSKPMPVGGSDESLSPWVVCRNLLSHYGWQLFYDGDGWLCVRPSPASGTPMVRFDASNMTSSPSIDGGDLTQIRNRLASKGMGTAFVNAYLPVTHPFSMQSQVMNGSYQESVAFEDRTDLPYAAQKVWAVGRIAQLGTQSVGVSFSAYPQYHLTPSDWGHVTWDGLTYGTHIDSASIPLGSSGPMTVGYNKSVRRVAAGTIGRKR